MLADTNTYKILKSDPTNKYKETLIKKLDDLRARNLISDRLYYQLKPTSENPPRFYTTPKIHKPVLAMRPIVSNCGTILYQLAKYLTGILKPLVGKSPYHLKNSQQLVKDLQSVSIGPNEEFVSVDVSALFTSIPTDKALVIIRKRLEEDTTLFDRTDLPIDDIMDLMEMCLNCTYFTYQGKIYQQIFGTAMGSPLSPVVANLYMEDLEVRAIATARHPPKFYRRYVDDSGMVHKTRFIEEFLDHLNSMDDHIKFTIEREENGQLPLLDTLMMRSENNKIATKVFRKSTHTDQYLNYQSHHPLEHKRSVVNSLVHRANTIVTKEEDKKQELKHISEALTINGYPRWVIKQQKERNTQQEQQKVNNQEKRECTTASIPYVKGLSERCRAILQPYKIATSFRPHTTLRKILVHPKDKTHKLDKTGVVYKIQCKDCPETYIGETLRKTKLRVQHHGRKSSTNDSPMAHHIHHNKHRLDIKDTNILDQETDWTKRGIKEAIYIRKERPTLNRDEGRHRLSRAWDILL